MTQPEYPAQIRGRTVLLRDFRVDDEDAVLEIAGDVSVSHWLSHDSKNREEVRAMLAGAIERAQLQPRQEWYLAVVVPASDRVVGFARLARAGVEAGKFGCAIRADEQRNGYATDAARTLIDFGFRDLKLHRISVAIGPDNARSIAGAKRLGFQYEGRLRDHVFTNGAWRDSLLYSMLAHEWNPV